ncbi:MAG: hypothetical protein J6Y07_02475 [Alphaproteobacteria bacterium]|nr:hypothetical protein [Alphaproteobacteria bacterium]
MKKIALTSLLTIVAASVAHAGVNVMDGNPLYMPKAGHFYSETALSSHSEHGKDWTLGEVFGYGINNNLALTVETSVSEIDAFDGYAWNDASFGLTARLFKKQGWVADIYGGYGVAPVWGDHRPFLDKDDTGYAWTAGVRAGYMTARWTVAGFFDFNYLGSESFNWDEEGRHALRAGVAGQFVIDANWNLVADATYTGWTDDGVKNAGSWEGKFGVNYNIDSTKYIGAYISAGLEHSTGDWEWADGVGYGVKFGIDF